MAVKIKPLGPPSPYRGKEDHQWRACAKGIPAKGGARLLGKWLAGLLVARKVTLYTYDQERNVFLVARDDTENEGVGTDAWRATPLSIEETLAYCVNADPDLAHVVTSYDRDEVVKRFKLGAAPKPARLSAAKLRALLEEHWADLPDHVRAEANALGVGKEQP